MVFTGVRCDDAAKPASSATPVHPAVGGGRQSASANDDVEATRPRRYVACPHVAMDRDPDTDAPPPAVPAPASEESEVRAPSSNRDDTGADEEHVRDVDPHPDTPDDFDDDASSPRESIETIRHDADSDDDD
jgi:hypothetical protein